MSGPFKNETRMRIEKKATLLAAQHRSRNERVWICESVPRHGLLIALPVAVRASKLAVESLKLSGCGRKHVLVPLDSLQNEVWVHRDEVHEPIVGQEL